jgi:hypothetical protein
MLAPSAESGSAVIDSLQLLNAGDQVFKDWITFKFIAYPSADCAKGADHLGG